MAITGGGGLPLQNVQNTHFSAILGVFGGAVVLLFSGILAVFISRFFASRPPPEEPAMVWAGPGIGLDSRVCCMLLQESELCHLRAALKEQTQANEEAHIAMKNQEKVIQELKAQGKDPTAEKTVELLQKQLMEKESALKLLEASNKQLQDQVEKAKKPAEQAAIPTEF